MIYFDNAATTYPKPESVYQAMDDVNRTMAVNSGRGTYALAQKANMLILNTKEKIKKLVKANDVAEVVFTPSATLACNQIIGGIDWNNSMTAYVSPYEHNAVARPLHLQKKKFGFDVEELAINPETLELDVDKIAFQFSQKRPDVLFISHVSNVIGYIAPLKEILDVAEQYHPIVVVDASQAMGLVPIELRNMGIDFYIFAGHKTPYGPFGIGGYVNNRGFRLSPYITGGTGSDSLNLDSDSQETGSPNIVAVAGLGAALDTLEPERILKKEQKITENIVERLKNLPNVTIYTPQKAQNRVGIVSFNVEGYKASDIGTILSEEFDIAIRTGYQCAPYIHKWLNDEDYLGLARVSVGQFTTDEMIQQLFEAIESL